METPKTLDDIRAVKGVFPADEIEPGDSVLDLMCAGFYGANAAIHVIDRGATRYFGVDRDEPKIEVMRALYPEDVCYFTPQCVHGVIALRLRENVRSDVVICDPWTQDIAKHVEARACLESISSRAVILGVSSIWLKERDLDPTPESINRWDDEQRRYRHFACTRVIRRSDHLGGTFWTVWR